VTLSGPLAGFSFTTIQWTYSSILLLELLIPHLCTIVQGLICVTLFAVYCALLSWLICVIPFAIYCGLFLCSFWDLPSVDYPRVPSHPPLSIGLLGLLARITLGPLRVVL
jgi:hypothetical protein